MFRLFWKDPDVNHVQLSLHETKKGGLSAFYRRVTKGGAESAALWDDDDKQDGPIREKLTHAQQTAVKASNSVMYETGVSYD